MSSAAQLGNLLNVTADLNYYTMMLNQWSAKYEANSKVLSEQVNYEEKWEDAYYDAKDTEKEISATHNGVTVKVSQGCSDSQAERYADTKVWQYDESLSLELAELDLEYDNMKTLYEGLVTQKQAEKDADKQSTATAMQDTHLLQS